MKVSEKVSFVLRDLIYPGLDLHTRNRACLSRFWMTGPRDVLDAGSGNGYFSWLAYKSGATVEALNCEAGQVARARTYFLEHRRADPARLRFLRRNLYDLSTECRTFDEVICYETLEHIRGDTDVLKQFYRVLRPGGLLHLCCPYRLHPRHQAERLDLTESGGHVRAGYTEQDYERLLEPLGFNLERFVGIGPNSVYLADKIMRAIRNRVGDWAALPLLPFGILTVKLSGVNPAVPFCLYVTAVKPIMSEYRHSE